MKVKYLFKDTLYSGFFFSFLRMFFIRWFLFLSTCLVTLSVCFTVFFFKYTTSDSLCFWHERLLMVTAIRSIDVLIDQRTGDDKTAFLVISPDPVVWKQRKCYANDLLIPLHYLFHFSLSFSHSISSTASWQADTLRLLILKIEKKVSHPSHLEYTCFN